MVVTERKHIGIYFQLILGSMKTMVDRIPMPLRHARAASMRMAYFLNVYNPRSQMPPAFSTARWISLPLLRASGEDIILTRAEQIMRCLLFFGVGIGEAWDLGRSVCFEQNTKAKLYGRAEVRMHG
jgi:hypothetical protein